MLISAPKLYNKLLNIYKTQYDILTKVQKKSIKVQNVPENLPINLYLDKDNLPPLPALEGDEKLKLESEETIAERIKLNPRKRKKYRNKIKSLNSKKFIN